MENEDDLLKSGMTGHAKIEGETTIVLIAFTRALVRYVLVEAWSWLP
jgi:putative peptide zinc metalloprotease protein